MGTLLVSLGSLPVLALRVSDRELRLGRAPGNDVILPLPDVADAHALVVPSGSSTTIQSIGGESLLVNGRAVERAELSPADVVMLGGDSLRWLGDEGPVAGGAAGDASLSQESHETNPVDPQSQPQGGDGLVARVRVVVGRDLGLECPLERPSLLVGRSPDCDLVLTDDTITWRHLSLERTPEGVRVRDLGSRNGTFLDGQRIESAVGRAGSRVRAGRTTLELQSSGPPVAPGETLAWGLAEMAGRSSTMQKVYSRIKEAAISRLPVLLLGQTGTGKELAARAIHAVGPRASRPFVPVNCAAMPREMIEDTLFGHAEGSFTGATGSRRGAFEATDGGTIFLDEIAEMPLDLQAKLLRVVEDGRVPRVGGEERRYDFRVLAATNRSIADARSSGCLRPDLYFRLSTFEILLPPLSERVEDLPDLVHALLASSEPLTGVAGAGETRFEESAFIPLREYEWPGNVRELRNVILRAVVRRPGGLVDRDLIDELLSESSPRESPEEIQPLTLEDAERRAIRNALRDCNGQRRAAARRLGIAESTLYEKIRRYGLGKEGGSP